MSIGSSSRNGARVRWIVVHTAEGARTAHDLYNYFNKSGVQASSHAIVDHDTTLDNVVDYSRAAWTLRNGNEESDNLEQCAFAKWTRAQWLSAGTVDGCVNPRAILDRTAAWIRKRCTARGIPIRKLSPARIADGQSGVIGHIDYTRATGDGTHWDPGPGFPWDYVINKAREGTVPTKEWWEMAIPNGELEAIGKAVWAASLNDPRDGDRDPAATQLSWTYKSVRDLEDKLDKLSSQVATILAKVSA